jgi:3-phenylpropionate/cinnamic acid dioxygenase small subunit
MSGAGEPDEAADRIAVVDLLTRYATALDHRDWALLDQIFTADAEGRYGGPPLVGCEALRRMIRGMLDGCGPTQHLLGNFIIELAGDEAHSVCSVRAFHAGIGAAAGHTYEVFGEYRDALVRLPQGWRVARRSMWVSQEIGSREVLGPGKAAR